MSESYATREAIEQELEGRHAPVVVALLRHFAYDHLPEPLRHISQHCNELAMGMALSLPGGPEKTAGLRKLLEAKDCFVRAELDRPS